MSESQAPRLFGTDGIRGRAGEAPIDEPTLERLGSALASVLGARLPGAPRVVIGRDTRESGAALAHALARGAAAQGAEVRSAGVVPTPAISLLARSEEFDIGVVVSASHNPWTDNGVKVFGSEGTKLPDDLERAVEAHLARGACEPPSVSPSGGPSRAHAAPLRDEPDLRRRHADWLASHAREWGLDLSGRRLVVDCANGAASGLACGLLEGLGARTTTIHDGPDGRNINEACGALHVEATAAAVRAHEAELGVALDGDADRAIFVDSRGRTADGDVVLAVGARALRRRGALETGAVVGTVMSNLGLETALREDGVRLVRERVGDRAVLERMLAEGHELGGEPSGHVIWRHLAPCGDGLATLVELLRALEICGTSLDDVVDAFPRAPQALRAVRVASRPPLEEVAGLRQLTEAWRTRFGTEGRIVVRYSGTELAARVMVEGADEGLVEQSADELAACLQEAIGAPATA